MVFSSPPLYLDAPDWHQQFGSTDPFHDQNTFHFMHHAPFSSPGFVRPSTMAERARLAKIPQPETAINCPRCDSTNTKFCYFNNYSLTQPRHFCKTCRRYWTQGGALRNVPVGGGCRRNKRGKTTITCQSKSPPTISTTTTVSASETELNRFQMTTTHQSYNGVNFGSGAAVILDERFPFMPACAEPSYAGSVTSQLGSKHVDPIQLESKHDSAPIPPAGAVKMEGSKNTNMNEWFGMGSSSTRNFVGGHGIVGGNMNEQYGWMGSNSWINTSDLSGFASSSNSHLL